MNKLIKKNFLFFMFLFASGVASIVLIVIALMKHSAYEENYANLENLKNKVRSLTSQKPSPSQQNVDLINEDTAEMQALAKEMELHFGHPYTPALQAFVDVLNENMTTAKPPVSSDGDADSETATEGTGEPIEPFKITVADLMREFRTFWQVERDKGNQPVQILPMFKMTQGWEQVDANGDTVKVFWDNETWDRALQAFGDAASKISFEEVGQKNIEAIFMMSMGIARTFDSGDSGFPFFEKEYRTRLASLCNKKNIGLSSGGETFKIDVYTPKGQDDAMSMAQMMAMGVNVREMMENAAAEEDSKKKTNETEQQAYDARSWEVIGDMVRRIADSGIDSIDDFAATTREGIEDSGYRSLRFQFEVTGHLESIRKVCDILNDAWKDNRVYIIRLMNLEKLDDGAQGIIDAAQKLREQALNEASSSTAGYGYGYNDYSMNRVNNPVMMMGSEIGVNRTQGNGNSNINPNSVPGQRLKARSSQGNANNAMAMMMGEMSSGSGSGSGNRRQGVQKYLWDERVSYWQSLLEPDHSEDSIAYYARKNYGMPIIGGNMRMRAMFVVQYVCFEDGEMLK